MPSFYSRPSCLLTVSTVMQSNVYPLQNYNLQAYIFLFNVAERCCCLSHWVRVHKTESWKVFFSYFSRDSLLCLWRAPKVTFYVTHALWICERTTYSTCYSSCCHEAIRMNASDSWASHTQCWHESYIYSNCQWFWISKMTINYYHELLSSLRRWLQLVDYVRVNVIFSLITAYFS